MGRLATGVGAVLFGLSLLVAHAGRREGGKSRRSASFTPEKEPQNWLTFYGNYKAWSYSPLNQITGENVHRLVPAWTFPTGGHGGLESAPIIADGKLYLVVDQNNDVFAMDAVTGKLIWNYAYKAAKDARPGNGKSSRISDWASGCSLVGTRENHCRRSGCRDRQGDLEYRNREFREVRMRDQFGAAGW